MTSDPLTTQLNQKSTALREITNEDTVDNDEIKKPIKLETDRDKTFR